MKKKRTKKILIFSAVFIITAILLSFVVMLIYSTTLDIDKTKLEKTENSIQIFDESNQLVSQCVEYANIDEIPDNLKNAFIASEDKRFYRHKGLDYYRILGAIYYDVKTQSFAQGASTISCQLIKNTHLNNEKSVKRKINEAILAKKLEKQYTKDEILEKYLNLIYFGNGLYGISNASFTFFGKKPSELTLSECASLSAIVANPTKFSPLYNNEKNNERKNTILKLMLDQGYITTDQYEVSRNEIVFCVTNSYNHTFSYNQIAIDEASDILGISALQLKQNGYKIYTYLDSDLQRKCVEATERNDVSTSILVADNDNYTISAYSANHRFSPFSMRRNCGSIIKPFVYATAFENGIIYPITQIDDEQTTFGDYAPKNYADSYKGRISVRESLAYSSNVCAVKVFQSAGFNHVQSSLSKFGFNVTSDDDNYAFALGAMKNGVTIEQVASAYSVFAHSGQYQRLSTVRMIENKDGKIVYVRNLSPEQIISNKTSEMINDCLNYCAKKGTAKKLSEYNDYCAKTGTFEVGDKNSDSWLVAYDDRRLYCVWQGNLSMKKEDMIAKTGSSGIDVISDVIDKKPRPTKRTVNKSPIDRLFLERNDQIRLASANTPERYVIYDYVPDEVSTSTLFTSPTVDCGIELIDDIVCIKLNACKECNYEVFVDDVFGIRRIAIIENENRPIEIKFQAVIGQNSIKIIPTAKGLVDAVGEIYVENVYY